MPELPEVETVRRGLAPALVGRRIVGVKLGRPDLRFPFPARFAARLKGRRVVALNRRAKYLLAHLDDNAVWITHLGMTGRWSILGAPRQPGDFYYAEPTNPTHTHVTIETEAGARLEFNDPRRFGYMDLIAETDLTTHAYFKGMGPEPLGNEFHLPYLKRALSGKKTSIKAALLDQRLVAGLGNIYVVEALHRAGIAPTRAAGRIGEARLEHLYHAIRAVLEEAIEAGGSTLSDYAAVDGAQGGFQHRFRVYGREGAGCVAAGCSGVIARKTHGGRSSFWCPRCQR
ncbi:MAG: bifunctional DNA-formamidopyrimidine glycosylase/DNA-(apurinic or apyrimidinic site) lyase [Hyphomonadaceae bacterium]|nr:bifunctional DNA-formamidopyrimidine glycosylase/DNA-(apurinic or apyrimidinic site) lyase [Hyphomonadaceae bacterium]